MKRPAKISRILPHLCGLAAAVVAPLPSQASAQVRAKADISLEGSAESNPFLSIGNDTEVLGVGLRIDPAVYIEGDTTTATIEGGVRLEQFSRRYGSNGSARLRVGLSHALDERTVLRVDASGRSSRSLVRDFATFRLEDEFAFSPDANGSLEQIDLPAPDVSAAGRRARVTSLSSGASLDHALNARDSLSFGFTAGITRSQDRLGGDYQTAGGSAFFRRRISERTGIFASVRGGLADYRNSIAGDGIFLTPMLGLDYRLSDRLSVNLSAGVSFTVAQNGEGEKVRRTSVAGDLALCRRQANGSLCAAVSRRAQPTLYGGITTATNANVTYVRSLSDRDQLSFGGSYGRSEGGISARSNVAGRPRELVSTFVDYRREIGERLSAFIAPRYERIFDRTSEDRDNVAIIAGITYRIGSVR